MKPFGQRPELWESQSPMVIENVLQRRSTRMQERRSTVAIVVAFGSVLGAGGLWVNVLADKVFGADDGLKLLSSLAVIAFSGFGTYLGTKAVLQKKIR